MLTKRGSRFEAKCDVCGRSEHFDAGSHAEAWDKLKRAAWCARKNAFPIIHICPECPVEAPRAKAN